jgi:hypothetical protein
MVDNPLQQQHLRHPATPVRSSPQRRSVGSWMAYNAPSALACGPGRYCAEYDDDEDESIAREDYQHHRPSPVRSSQRRPVGSWIPSPPSCGVPGGRYCVGENDNDDSMMAAAAAANNSNDQVRSPPHQQHRQQQATTTAASGVRTIVEGLFSQFWNCVQPPLHAAVSPASHQAWDDTRRKGGPARPPPHSSAPYRPEKGSLLLRGGSNCSSSSRRAPYHPELYPPASVSSPKSIASAGVGVVVPEGPPCIRAPSTNDILCGRGNSNNKHPGNLNFRDLILANKARYTTLTKKEKMLLAREIAEIIHATDPPGRFIGKDAPTGQWYDIGTTRSLEKISQALRERSTKILNPADVESITSNETLTTTTTTANETETDVESTSTGGAAVAASSLSTRKAGQVMAPPVTIPPCLAHVYRKRDKSRDRIPTEAERKQQQKLTAIASFQNTTTPPMPQGPATSSLPPFKPSAAPLYLPNGMMYYPPPPPPYPQHHHPRAQPPLHPLSVTSSPGFSPPRPAERRPGHPAAIVTPLTTVPQPIYSSPIASSSKTEPVFPKDVFQNPNYNGYQPNVLMSRAQNPGHLSPSRDHDWKRQRTSTETTHRRKDATLSPRAASHAQQQKPTDTSMESLKEIINSSTESSTSKINSSMTSNGSSTGLTRAIETKLTLDDLEPYGNRMQSPSFLMQSVGHSRRERSLPKMSDNVDMSADSMDGLSALASAAYLRLDEI